MMRTRYDPRWTYVFIAACVIGFILQQATDEWVYLVFFPAYALKAPWMFLTSVFLHADPTHLFFNMFALFFFGTSLERRIGGKAFVSLFLLSGILGNAGYLVTAADPYTPALGASGAIYGVMGTLAILEPFMMVFIYGMLPVPMIVAAALWALIDLAGLLVPSGIAHGAHLGGMLVGIVFGIRVRQQRSRQYSARYL